MYEELMSTIHSMYPNFQTWRIVMAGPVGSGKSVAAASFPVPENTKRLVLDMEDSMAFIDAGVDGKDIYTPRKQRFAMERLIYPQLSEIGKAIFEDNLEGVGVLVIDNIAVLQDNIVQTMQTLCKNPKSTRDLFNLFNASNALPFDSQIVKWQHQKDPGFWASAKALVKSMIMTAMKNGVHIIGTSEEQNVWQNYGTQDAKVIGKKAKIWDVWFRYFDAVIMLERNINTTNPPWAALNPLQPKLRLQGFNPKWQMDWQGFITELAASLEREEPKIPEELHVIQEETFEED